MLKSQLYDKDLKYLVLKVEFSPFNVHLTPPRTLKLQHTYLKAGVKPKLVYFLRLFTYVS